MKQKVLSIKLLSNLVKKTKALKLNFLQFFFNSTTTTVIKSKFGLDKPSKETLYRIENWINEGSGWIVESIDFQYINISTFRSYHGVFT